MISNVQEEPEKHSGRLDTEDPRVYLAAQRTLLAWIRTGLALMGFGFVVAKFGMFLHEFTMLGGYPSRPGTGFSLWIGTALVCLGVVVSYLAAAQHARLVSALERREAFDPSRGGLETAVAIITALMGLVLAAYLVTTGN